MPLIKSAIAAALALPLIAIAVVIVVFDASDIDIARPPSLAKDVSSPIAAEMPPPPERVDDLSVLKAKLMADPLDRYALYMLSRAPAGDFDRARLLLLAAGRSRRDVEIQTAAIDYLLKAEQYAPSTELVDGLIRANPPLRYKLYDAIAMFARNAASRAPLVGLLAKDPPWRKDFLSYLPRTSLDISSIVTLIADLRATRSPPLTSELTPFISKLIANGTVEQAYSLWLTSLSEAQLTRAGFIYNGNFEARLSQLGPFDWIIVQAKNVRTRTVSTTSNERGTVLEIAFAGSRISYRNIYQRLLLPPGRFTLTGQYWANKLENDRGLAWRISCETSPDLALAETTAMKGTRDWGPFEVDFRIPDTGCVSQILRLELNAKAKLDLEVSGMLRFDNLKIERSN